MINLTSDPFLHQLTWRSRLNVRLSLSFPQPDADPFTVRFAYTNETYNNPQNLWIYSLVDPSLLCTGFSLHLPSQRLAVVPPQLSGHWSTWPPPVVNRAYIIVGLFSCFIFGPVVSSNTLKSSTDIRHCPSKERALSRSVSRDPHEHGGRTLLGANT